jgi:hypothetical protein
MWLWLHGCPCVCVRVCVRARACMRCQATGSKAARWAARAAAARQDAAPDERAAQPASAAGGSSGPHCTSSGAAQAAPGGGKAARWLARASGAGASAASEPPAAAAPGDALGTETGLRTAVCAAPPAEQGSKAARWAARAAAAGGQAPESARAGMHTQSLVQGHMLALPYPAIETAARGSAMEAWLARAARKELHLEEPRKARDYADERHRVKHGGLTEQQVVRERAHLNPPELSRTYSSIKQQPNCAQVQGLGWARSCLDSAASWQPSSSHMTEWMEIDAGKEYELLGLVTQAQAASGSAGGEDCYVARLAVKYRSLVTAAWESLAGDLEIGRGGQGRRETLFPEPIRARFVRLFPIDFHAQVALRAGLLLAEHPDAAAFANSPFALTSPLPPPVSSRAASVVDGACEAMGHTRRGGVHAGGERRAEGQQGLQPPRPASVRPPPPASAPTPDTGAAPQATDGERGNEVCCAVPGSLAKASGGATCSEERGRGGPTAARSGAASEARDDKASVQRSGSATAAAGPAGGAASTLSADTEHARGLASVRSGASAGAGRGSGWSMSFADVQKAMQEKLPGTVFPVSLALPLSVQWQTADEVKREYAASHPLSVAALAQLAPASVKVPVLRSAPPAGNAMQDTAGGVWQVKGQLPFVVCLALPNGDYPLVLRAQHEQAHFEVMVCCKVGGAYSELAESSLFAGSPKEISLIVSMDARGVHVAVAPHPEASLFYAHGIDVAAVGMPTLAALQLFEFIAPNSGQVAKVTISRLPLAQGMWCKNIKLPYKFKAEDWTLVFRQTAPMIFAAESLDSQLSQTLLVDGAFGQGAGTYSRLAELEQMRCPDGHFSFLLSYPSIPGKRNIWRCVCARRVLLWVGTSAATSQPSTLPPPWSALQAPSRRAGTWARAMRHA